MKSEVKNKLYNIVTFTTIVLFLFVVSSCGTSKKGGVMPDNVTVKELKKMPSLNNRLEHLSSKVKLSAKIGGKDFSVNGNIKIKRGEGLQISINALGGLIEVARIEMSPEKMLLIYRLGREYAEVRYNDIEALDRLGISYPMLEAILLNELFYPNERSLEKSLSKMSVTVANGEILLSTARERGMKYSFIIEQNSGCLQLTQGDYENKINVNCNYSDFVETDVRLFPRRIRLSVASSMLELRLTNPKTDNFRLNRTTELSSYKKVDISTLLKGIKF